MAKSKNNNTPFIRLFLIIEAVAFIVSAIASVCLGIAISTKSRYEAEYADKISFYQDNGFDFLVTGASHEQINEFNSKEFITHVTSASKLNLNVTIDSQEDYRNILVYDSLDDLEYSEFTGKRIISENEFSHSIFVDYKFCDLYDVSLGDELCITVNGEKEAFVISRIYRTDYLYSEGVLIATKDMIPLISKSLYVYLNTSSKNDLMNYLQDYKPLGTLSSRKPNQSDEDYQNYLDEFNAKKYYSSYVTDLSIGVDKVIDDYSNKLKVSTNNFYIFVSVFSVLSMLTSLLCFFVNAKNKKDKIYKYIQENGSAKIYTIYTKFNLSFMIFMMAGMFISMGVVCSGLATYYTFISVLTKSYLAIVAPVISILLGYLISAIKIKKA